MSEPTKNEDEKHETVTGIEDAQRVWKVLV